MPNIGVPELLFLGLYVLVVVGIVYGVYRLIRLAVRRELQERDKQERDKDDI